MSHGVLVDTTLCIACRGCQVSCKRENGLPAEKTTFNTKGNGMQNPSALSSTTFTYISYSEVEQGDDLKWVFAKHQCMHCAEPACASACLVGALTKTDCGAVVYDAKKCIGCRYCMLACPFNIPTFEWEKTIPFIKKCSFCFDRQEAKNAPSKVNGKDLPPEQAALHAKTFKEPACTRACPTGALLFGDRKELLAIAKERIAKNPGKYVKHVYGEKEAGGTSWIYISSVPFASLGLPAKLGNRSFPSYARAAKEAVPYVIFGVGALLSGFYWFSKRRSQLEQAKEKAK
ncbi:MAG: 4Fe-4S dicluster domain-containing protein [Polyangia bacterium]|jgi:formate dehydrogenase iron-sulfur subunit|nr:4Fe-4S dicluster domain-containing protein [Polyangia bacterium]